MPSTRTAVLVMGLMLLAVIATGGVAGTAPTQGDATSVHESVNRTTTTSVAPGETVEITVDVNLNQPATDLQVIESFDPAFADVEIVDSDGATVAAVTDANDQATASWGLSQNVTLVYAVTIPESAAPGDEFTINGTVDADDTVTTTGTDTLVVDVVDSVERDIDSGVAPGGSVTADLAVNLSSTADVNVTETFSPAVTNLTVVAADGATVATATSANDEIFASWGNASSVTLSYELAVPTSAVQGDQYNVSGTVDVAGTTVDIGTDELVVSERPDAVEYADEETGKVGASGVGSAAADFRSSNLDPSALGEVAAAFRSGERVR